MGQKTSKESAQSVLESAVSRERLFPSARPGTLRLRVGLGTAVVGVEVRDHLFIPSIQRPSLVLAARQAVPEDVVECAHVLPANTTTNTQPSLVRKQISSFPRTLVSPARVARCHRPSGQRHLRKSGVFRPQRQYALGRPAPPPAHSTDTSVTGGTHFALVGPAPGSFCTQEGRKGVRAGVLSLTVSHTLVSQPQASSAMRWSAVATVAKTKELKKRSWGMKKAKNHHVSFGKSRLARAALPFSAGPRPIFGSPAFVARGGLLLHEAVATAKQRVLLGRLPRVAVRAFVFLRSRRRLGRLFLASLALAPRAPGLGLGLRLRLGLRLGL